MKVNLMVDLGNSETRVIMLAGGQRKLYGLSNHFALLPSGYKVSSDYINNDNCVFEDNGNYYAVGPLADREFVGQLIRPSAIHLKCAQIATKLSLNYVLISAITNLATMLKQTPDSLESLEVDLAVLVPPSEHDTHIDAMKEFISEIKKVHQIIPVDFTIPIIFEKISVYPESFTAFFAAYYDTSAGTLNIRESNARFGEGVVLCLDIGSGTTDVCLINQGSLVLESKDTFKIGGNTVEAHLRKSLVKEYSFCPTVLTPVVLSGVLQDGDTEHDVANLVKEAKEFYTKTFIADLLPDL